MNLRNELETRVAAALVAAGAPEGSPALVAPSANTKFGDYQANGVMAAAKKLRANPRELAAKVLAQLQPGGGADLSALAEKIEIAGPGFINITLKREFLEANLAALSADDKLGAAAAAPPQTVVVDYSGPNLAKEMHVGHLRSTIIGDALARVLEFLGHRVIRQNHVGDWGTQFGMLIAYMDKVRESGTTDDLSVELSDLEEFYRKAKQLFDTDENFAQIARQNVVKLQGGDDNSKIRWLNYTAISLLHCEEVYKKLDVKLSRDDVRGESSYNADLSNVIADLGRAALLTESQGAKCVFLPGFVNKDGEPLPLIVQKSDEGYLYATTDLAAVRYRVATLHADRILYVTDSRQALHFSQMFAVARAAGFAPASVSLEHVPFGTMLGNDGKPFKTRTGGTVKLMDLLAEAVERAQNLVAQKNPDLPADQQGSIAAAVGIGAVKYADLSQNRNSDYVFSWDKMLAMEGNTAPYMQYAYARIKSIFRKGELACGPAAAGRIELVEPAERALAVSLMQLGETLDRVAAECLPNILCAYLYDLAGAFTAFYENCPVLKSDEPVRSSRLRLCQLTARTIHAGLSLLGIATIEQM